MAIFEIHTNIPLDYPTSWTGSIYREDNIRTLFESDQFIDKIVSGELVGTVGFKKTSKIAHSLISHVVVDAYISETKEIVFKIETMNTESGRKLDAMLSQNPFGYLAKLIAIIDVEKSVDGVQHLVDIKYVHVDENDCVNRSKRTKT